MAERIPEYDELTLRMGRGDAESSYRLDAFGPNDMSATETFTYPFSKYELENFILKMGARREGVRGFRSPQMEVAKQFGSKLGAALLKGEVHAVYLRTRALADEYNRGLRVRISFTDVPELMEIPWEFLYEQRSFLSQSIYTPVVRSLDLSFQRPRQKLTWPLRMVGVVSSPQGWPQLDVDKEKAKIEEALGALRSEGMVEITWVESATMQAVWDAIDKTPGDKHVLHYIGHGAFDRNEGGTLIFEDAAGRDQKVSGDDLGMLLTNARSLRLAVLNSCEGARGGPDDPFSGVASGLVANNIPAVIAMQFQITDEAAKTFSESFYTDLARGLPVDAALAQARTAIFVAGYDIEFGTPVLFLRGAETQLWDPPPRPPPDDTDVLPQGSFTVRLEQLSKKVVATEAPWQLSIKNTGPCPLSDVAAKRADVTPVGEPEELGVDSGRVIRWRGGFEPSARELITVTAQDPGGSVISEQVEATPKADARRLVGEAIGLAAVVGFVATVVTEAILGSGLSEAARVLTRLAIWTPVGAALGIWLTVHRWNDPGVARKLVLSIGWVAGTATLAGAIFVLPDGVAQQVRVVLSLTVLGAGLGGLMGALWSRTAWGVIVGLVAGAVVGLIDPIGDLPRALAVAVRSAWIVGLTLGALLFLASTRGARLRRTADAG